MKKFSIILFLCFIGKISFSQDKTSVSPAFEDYKSFQNVRDFTLTSTGLEGYLSIQSPREEVSVIVKINKVLNKWAVPEVVPFSGKYKDLEPFLSPDNLKLYFVSNRPLYDSLSEVKDFDIWYVERETIDSKWSNPINLGTPINTDYNEFYPAVTANNNLYYTSDSPNSMGKDDIFQAKWSEDHYLKPIPLSEAINSEGFEFNAFVAPDESFLIFSGYNRTDGLGSGDMYISFKNDNDNWTEARNLGKSINSDQMDYCPFVDVKTNSLYFTSRRSEVDTSKPIKNTEDLINNITQYENGLSRIYKVVVDLELLKPNK